GRDEHTSGEIHTHLLFDALTRPQFVSLCIMRQIVLPVNIWSFLQCFDVIAERLKRTAEVVDDAELEAYRLREPYRRVVAISQVPICAHRMLCIIRNARDAPIFLRRCQLQLVYSTLDRL